MDDSELVEQFQAGDGSAFEALVTRYRRQVYAVARGILRDHAQADEAAQEAFIRAWNGLARFRGDSTFRTWITRIAMNAAFDLRSREASRTRTRDEWERDGATARDLGSRPHVLDGMIDREQAARVHAAVEGLPERQRLTLTLKVQQGLKYTEIAEVMGCPVGTAKANFHHAVRNLRKALGTAAPDTNAEDDDREDDSPSPAPFPDRRRA